MKRTLLRNCDESLLVLGPVMFAAPMARSLSIPGIQSGIQRKVSKMYSASLYNGIVLQYETQIILALNVPKIYCLVPDSMRLKQHQILSLVKQDFLGLERWLSG